MTDLFFLILFRTKSEGELTSLDKYISRMKSGQKDIFYLTGTSKEQLENSPFLERLKKKNYEVYSSEFLKTNWRIFYASNDDSFLSCLNIFPLIGNYNIACLDH